MQKYFFPLKEPSNSFLQFGTPYLCRQNPWGASLQSEGGLESMRLEQSDRTLMNLMSPCQPGQIHPLPQ